MQKIFKKSKSSERRNTYGTKIFFICNHCGNMIAFVNDSGIPVVCCGELMHEVIPGVIDASIEKHVPVYSVKDGIVHGCRFNPSPYERGSPY